MAPTTATTTVAPTTTTTTTTTVAPTTTMAVAGVGVAVRISAPVVLWFLVAGLVALVGAAIVGGRRRQAR